ncbi:MAG: PD-(D/E)XK nuclease family protein [Firmicutes bacterium]|nr:PD-(D/E)XK nuclease family protein [Bacillota bacterium]
MKEFVREISVFDKNTIVFSPNQLKNKILQFISETQQLYPFKFHSLFESSLSLKSDYLLFMKKHFSLDPNYSSKCVFIFDYLDVSKEYDSQKINYINSIFKELIKNDMIQFNSFQNFEQKQILFLNNCKVPFYLKKWSPVVTYLGTINKNEIILYECQSILDSQFAVFKKVTDLLSKGIMPNDIYLLNSTKEDRYQLAKLLKEANIPFYSHYKMALNQFPITISFVNKLKKASLDEAIYLLTDLIVNCSSFEKRIIKKIFDIINKYEKNEIESEIDILIFEISNASIQEPFIQGAIHFQDLSEINCDDIQNYLILNYQDQSLPLVHKDNDFLLDEEKKELNMYTSFQENELDKTHTENLINRMKNVTFFYSTTENNLNRRVAELSLSHPLITMKFEIKLTSVEYTNNFYLLHYAKQRYQKVKYSVEYEDFNRLEYEFASQYRMYNPQFRQINTKLLSSLLNNKVYLSATSLQTYYECSFHFLLDYLLKIKNYDKNINLYFGNLTHKFLELWFNDKAYELSEIENNLMSEFPEEMNYKYSLFLEIIQNELKLIRMHLINQKKHTTFLDFAFEKEYRYFFENDPRFIILGKIDKIMIHEIDNQVEVVVIDYKTGNKSFVLSDFEKGIEPQLPFYFHLLSSCKQFDKMKPVGFYYQKVNIGRYYKLKNHDPIKKTLKMNGITLTDKASVDSFDSDDNIMGVTYNKNGEFTKNNRLKNSTEFEQILSQMNQQLLEAISSIQNGKFQINPLPVEKSQHESKSCEYCPHKGICYTNTKTYSFEEQESTDEGDEFE